MFRQVIPTTLHDKVGDSFGDFGGGNFELLHYPFEFSFQTEIISVDRMKARKYRDLRASSVDVRGLKTRRPQGRGVQVPLRAP